LKVVAIALWPVLAVAILGFAPNDDVSGKWTATMQRGDQTGNFVMNLQVEGDRLTGTLDDPSGQILDIDNGKVEGDHLIFDAAAQDEGRSKIIHFAGVVADDQLTLRNVSNGKDGRTIVFHRIAE
jgi:hypothetical protein